jgi:predicted dehydrogenase
MLEAEFEGHYKEEKGMRSSRVGTAVIGCGYWGMNYVRVLSELPECQLIAACDQRHDRLLEVSSRFPRVRVSTCVGDVIRDPQVDAIVICTEATTHYAVSSACISAGKHVLVEKPIATTLHHAEELTALAESNSVTLMVGHTFIYNSGITKVKEFITNPRADVYYLYARRTNLGPIRRDVNALWDLATHDIAIFNYLLESGPSWVSAVGGKVLRNCREDVGFVTLGYGGNILGHIHVSWADPNKARETVVVCSDKRIVFNDLNSLEQVRVFKKGVCLIDDEKPMNYGEYRLQIRDGDILSPRLEIAEPLKEQCRHYIHCVNTGEPPLTGGQAGVEVLRVLEAIDRSIRMQGTRVEVTKDGQYAQYQQAA